MRSLAFKLTLAFLVVSLVGTTLVALFVATATKDRFGEYMVDQFVVQVADRWAQYYAVTGSWRGVAERVRVPVLGIDADRLAGREPPPEIKGRQAQLVLADQGGRVIVPGLGFRVGQRLSVQQMSAGVPIEVDGKQVGVLLVAGRPTPSLSPANRFLIGFYNALLIGSLSATVIAVVLGVVGARSLTRPLRELTAATQAMAQGDLGQRIPVRSQDELGELARSFNQMGDELGRAQDLRRQMTADIAHELRTPLSLILGHAEALSDGVLPASPETFEIIHDEAQRLARLVDDLRTLSLSDAGELPMAREKTSPAPMLERVLAAYRPQARERGVSLELQAQPYLPDLSVDSDRMAQVLGNLLSNAIQYTPDDGRIVAAAEARSDSVRLTIRDSGPGIAPEDLPHIFDRFYRGDKSRRRDQGGSGLGLAIARSIVEAHDGRIWAESAPGEGATLVVSLPVARGSAASGDTEPPEA